MTILKLGKESKSGPGLQLLFFLGLWKKMVIQLMTPLGLCRRGYHGRPGQGHGRAHWWIKWAPKKRSYYDAAGPGRSSLPGARSHRSMDKSTF